MTDDWELTEVKQDPTDTHNDTENNMRLSSQNNKRNSTREDVRHDTPPTHEELLGMLHDAAQTQS